MKALHYIERTTRTGSKPLRRTILLTLIIASGSGAANASSPVYYAPSYHSVASVCPTPSVLYDGVFHIAAGRSFVSHGYGPRNLSLWIGQDRRHQGIDAYVQSHNRGNAFRVTLFSLPRNLHAAARILNANNWQFSHVQDGYRIHVIIDRIWEDRHAVQRCTGRVIITQLAPQPRRQYAHPAAHAFSAHSAQRPSFYNRWEHPRHGTYGRHRQRP